jgi:hypothetical protein
MHITFSIKHLPNLHPIEFKLRYKPYIFGQFIRIKVVLENSPAVFIRVATA